MVFLRMCYVATIFHLSLKIIFLNSQKITNLSEFELLKIGQFDKMYQVTASQTEQNMKLVSIAEIFSEIQFLSNFCGIFVDFVC